MTWLLLIYDNRAQCIFACYRLADYDGRPNLHVKIVAWCLYHLHNFKLRAWFNTLPNRDCKHGVLYYQNYRSLICFLTFFFSIHLVSSPFCWHYIFGFLSVSTYLLRLFASQICSPFTILPQFPRLELESRTGTWTHISVMVKHVLL